MKVSQNCKEHMDCVNTQHKWCLQPSTRKEAVWCTGQDSLFHIEVRQCLVWGFGWGFVVVLFTYLFQCSIIHWTPLAQEGSRSPCCNSWPGRVRNKVWVSLQTWAHRLLARWEEHLLSVSYQRGNNIWSKNCIYLIGTTSPAAVEDPTSEVTPEGYFLL